MIGKLPLVCNGAEEQRIRVGGDRRSGLHEHAQGVGEEVVSDGVDVGRHCGEWQRVADALQKPVLACASG